MFLNLTDTTYKLEIWTLTKPLTIEISFRDEILKVAEAHTNPHRLAPFQVVLLEQYSRDHQAASPPRKDGLHAFHACSTARRRHN